VVHRLDRDTTGLLILARTDESHRAFRELIDERAVTREYTAAVRGHPPTAEGTIDAPIGRDRKRRTRVSTATDVPREAVTHFSVIETFPDDALLRVRLETGRTHQIRAHLASISLPVIGDPEYGPPGPAPLGLDRQFLHASRLEFVHPFSGDQIEVESPLPEDLSRVLNVLRGGQVA
jgi:23S rRNA pseudouridine1911/1915/1917 synthase